jgi:hypothetical protein
VPRPRQPIHGRRELHVLGSASWRNGAARCTTKDTGSLADVAELLGDSKRLAAEHYVYALTDYREVDRSIALARVAA